MKITPKNGYLILEKYEFPKDSQFALPQESGLVYEVIEAGTSEVCKKGDKVIVEGALVAKTINKQDFVIAKEDNVVGVVSE